VASIATGLVATLLFETLGYLGVYSFPAGVSVSGLSLVASVIVFIGVSWLTRRSDGATIDPDIRLVMEV
jgi:uncharacterized membrane protein